MKKQELHTHGAYWDSMKTRETPLETQAIWGYTCPKHLEVRQDKPGSCPECGMTLEPFIPQIHKVRPKWSRKFIYSG